jgi:hypothetical protein
VNRVTDHLQGLEGDHDFVVFDVIAGQKQDAFFRHVVLQITILPDQGESCGEEVWYRASPDWTAEAAVPTQSVASSQSF